MRSAGSKNGSEGRQDYLRQLAGEVMSRISEQDPSRSREMLAAFVAELFLSAAEQERQEARSKKQMERIAAAKKRGVRFGRQRLALPDGFEDMAQLWEVGGISAGYAAVFICPERARAIYFGFKRLTSRLEI